jgi:IS5 family transposase
VNPETGRPGMTGEQTLRAAIVRQMHGYSYEELSFHLADSLSFQRFCRIGCGDKPPSTSTLQRNIKRVRPETWEGINRLLVVAARSGGIERGRKARIDCTVVASPIHHPTDSSLLFDVVRVVARLMKKAKKHCRSVVFSDRTRRAKKRMVGVGYAKKSTARRNAYKDLIDVTIETLEFVAAARPVLEAFSTNLAQEGALEVHGVVEELDHYGKLGWQVLDQTHRRIFEDDQVSAGDKVVSIFEEHTDIIVKDRRETLFGHKVCLSTGPSSLVLDCVVLGGNPADSTLVEMMLDRHTDILGKPPHQAAFDGGFTSRANLKLAKDKGVKDICFHKKRGIEISEMARSTWVFKKLRNFRAGVEGCISFLKRSFGMGRCRWRGLQSFKSYVWASVVTCNLLIMARHALH